MWKRFQDTRQRCGKASVGLRKICSHAVGTRNETSSEKRNSVMKNHSLMDRSWQYYVFMKLVNSI
jgi:hypothetical protein